MNRGPDISWISCFPTEKEFLFPPLTYLQPTGREDELTGPNGEKFKVVEITPNIS